MSVALRTATARVPVWLDRTHARLRLVMASALALSIVSLEDWRILGLALLGAVVLAVAGGLRPATAGRRLLAFEGLMLVLLVLLPFSVPGRELFSIGPYAASQEGLERAVVLVLRANAVVLSLMTLVGTLEPVRFGHALAGLGVPDKLVHLLLFTVRYLAVLEQEFRRLRQAMRARGFVARSDRHTWRSLGWLIGMLLVRSMERSQRILAAMRCRGFDGRLPLLELERWRRHDTWIAVLALPVPALLPLLERLT